MWIFVIGYGQAGGRVADSFLRSRKYPSGANQLLAKAKHWMVPIS